MGADSYGKTAVLYLRVPDELHERMIEEAQVRGMTVTRFARQLLEEAIEALIPVDRFRLTR